MDELCYDTDKGYELGTVSYGGLSRIEVNLKQRKGKTKPSTVLKTGRRNGQYTDTL